MSRENIAVLYWISSDESLSTYPNFLNLSVSAGKEILLLDILAELPTAFGSLYEYWAKRNRSDSYILLQSPACVVPVMGTVIHLYMQKTHAAPHVPVKQAFLFNDVSRSNLYSVKAYQSATKQLTKTFQHQSSESRLNGHNREKFVQRKKQQLQINQIARNSFIDDSSQQFSSTTYDLNERERDGDGGGGNSNNYMGYHGNDGSILHDDNTSMRNQRQAAYSDHGARDSGKSHDNNSNSNRSSSSTNTNSGTRSQRQSYGDKNGGGSNAQEADRDAGRTKGRNSWGAGESNRSGGSSPVKSSGSGWGGTSGIAGININTDDIANAATQAAKSMFSFAALSLKTAVEAGQAAVSVQQQVFKVGLTKVSVVKELAQGGFGTVFLVQELPRKNTPLGQGQGQGQMRQLALKQILCQSKEEEREAHRELEHLERFTGHDCIIALIDHSSLEAQSPKGRIVRFLFPLYPHGTAWDTIERSYPLEKDPGSPWPFPEKRALCVVRDAAKGLAFMHGLGFAHRDIKPHNILLSPPEPSRPFGRAVLTDLGSVSAARCEIETRQQALLLEEEAALKSSAAFRAPELTSVNPPTSISEAVDVWSLGCTLFSLAFGRSPFETNEGVQRLGILNGRYQFPPGNRMRECKYGEMYVQLVKDMLQVDPANRPSVEEVAMRCDSLLD